MAITAWSGKGCDQLNLFAVERSHRALGVESIEHAPQPHYILKIAAAAD
jgi:hypothetical protein